MTELYHASATPLPIGTVLECRFIEDKLQFQFHAISSALKEGEAVLKSLLLSDYWHQLGKPTLTFAFKETVLERIRAVSSQTVQVGYRLSFFPQRSTTLFGSAKKCEQRMIVPIYTPAELRRMRRCFKQISPSFAVQTRSLR